MKIFDKVQTIIDNSEQPDIWQALNDALNFANTAYRVFGSTKPIQQKIDEVEAFLDAGEPYDMKKVEEFTNDLKELL